VPREDVVELEMSVDDGLKMLMSMGAVVPLGRIPAPLAEPVDSGA
jgi:uncharacterized membrane protein